MNKTEKHWMTVLTATLVAVMAPSGWAGERQPARPDTDNSFIEIAPHEARGTDAVDTAAHVPVLLSNGNQVQFVRMNDERGDAVGVGILELRRAGNRSVKDLFDLVNTHPVALFFALSKPGTRLPATLRDLYGEQWAPEEQGWASRELSSNGHPYHGVSGTCSRAQWDVFADAIVGYGYSYVNLLPSSGPTTSLDQWDVMTGWEPYYRRLRGSGYELSRIAVSVQWCQERIDTYRAEPPQVFVDVRHWNTNWTLVVSTALWDVGDEVNFHYTPLLTGVDQSFDARMRVSFALWDDLFNIGVTWSKPVGLLLED